MKQTIVVKLTPSAGQHAVLLATLKRFNAACDYIARVAFERRLVNKVALQKLVYY
jgi:putative transposase